MGSEKWAEPGPPGLNNTSLFHETQKPASLKSPQTIFPAPMRVTRAHAAGGGPVGLVFFPGHWRQVRGSAAGRLLSPQAPLDMRSQGFRTRTWATPAGRRPLRAPRTRMPNTPSRPRNSSGAPGLVGRAVWPAQVSPLTNALTPRRSPRAGLREEADRRRRAPERGVTQDRCAEKGSATRVGTPGAFAATADVPSQGEAALRPRRTPARSPAPHATAPSRARPPARGPAPHVTLIDSPAAQLSFSSTFQSSAPSPTSRRFPLAAGGAPRPLRSGAARSQGGRAGRRRAGLGSGRQRSRPLAGRREGLRAGRPARHGTAIGYGAE